MRKGRRYKTKEERERAIKFKGNRDMRHEMYHKTVNRTESRTIRRNSFFSLVYNKVENKYILNDLRENQSIEISKEVVKDEELAMTDNDNFNHLCREILSSRK